MRDTKQKIKPAEGAEVLNPTTGQKLKDGEPVFWTQYWERRLAEGSIVLVAGSLKERIEKQEKATQAKAKKGAKAQKPSGGKSSSGGQED